MIPLVASYTLGRALLGYELNGERDLLTEPWKPMAEHLARLDPVSRLAAWEAMLAARPDRDELIMTMAAINPEEPLPADTCLRSYATLADVAKTVSSQPWLWNGWLAQGVLNVLASDPGIGKTRFSLDLARRLHYQLPWPDGQPNILPAGSRTLWVQGDRNFAEMLQATRDFGVPHESVLLGSSPDEPFGSLDLDDPETIAALELRIRESGAVLAIIDTVGMCTSRNLTRPDEAREFFAPLLEMCCRSQATLLAQTHLSANKEALGRRIVEKARALLKMTQPDPTGQPNRRRLWVDKSAVLKPRALGITMGNNGNEYDFEPPEETELVPRKTGRSSEKLDACKTWLLAFLTPDPARVGVIRRAAEEAQHTIGTLYAARVALGVIESVRDDRKWWSLPSETAPAF